MKTRMLWGWLVVAAALTLGWTACSSEENVIDEPTLAPAVSTIHVSVGAGMGDEALTRSGVTEDVVDGKTQRTLKFTARDRLYVWGMSNQDDEYRIMGYLTMKEGSLSTDGKSANFEGELTLYKKGFLTEDNPFTTSDPLGECYYIEAHLIPDTFVEGFFEDNLGGLCYYEYGKSLATGDDCVNTLMTTALRVISSTYDATTKTFTNFKGYPIFNCTIGGLEEGEYYVKMDYAYNKEDYNSFSLSNFDSESFSSEGTVTVSDDGIARFAFSRDASGEPQYYALGLTKSGDNLDYLIKLSDNGPKQLEYNKVYNVTTASKPLSEVTEDEIGWRVGSDGNAYPPTGKLPSDVKAEAMIAYISSTGHGLAIAFEDACGRISWADAKAAVDTWKVSHVVPNGTWRMPSAYDWQHMLIGCGSENTYTETLTDGKKFDYGNLRNMLMKAAGKSADMKTYYYYWSDTTYYDSVQAWSYNFDDSRFLLFNMTTYTLSARACLAF